MTVMNVGVCLFFVVHFYFFFIGKGLSVFAFGYIRKGLDMQNTKKKSLHRTCFTVNFAKFSE